MDLYSLTSEAPEQFFFLPSIIPDCNYIVSCLQTEREPIRRSTCLPHIWNGLCFTLYESMAIGAIYLWSYVYNIVRISSTKKMLEVELNGSINGVPEDPLNISRNSCSDAPVPFNDCLMSRDEVDRFALPHSRDDETVAGPLSVKFKQQLKMLAGKINLKRLLAPSTIGAIVGFIVGVVAPFRRLMIGESAPLHVIQDSASLLGDGAIPTVSLIMGGNLVKGLKGSEVHIPIIIGIVVVRYVLSPLFGIFIV